MHGPAHLGSSVTNRSGPGSGVAGRQRRHRRLAQGWLGPPGFGYFITRSQLHNICTASAKTLPASSSSGTSASPSSRLATQRGGDPPADLLPALPHRASRRPLSWRYVSPRTGQTPHGDNPDDCASHATAAVSSAVPVSISQFISPYPRTA
jgi:hypothetical protein